MQIETPRVVIAGLRGGSGKTTLSIGLMRALRRRGLRVVPFKKGPDYIDSCWLARAAGTGCRNLDPYLIPEELIKQSFCSASSEADMAVIEGNRGLYDGMDREGSFSTAALARLLKVPVILIVDCTKATRTVAAMVRGVRDFEKGLQIGGIVLNRIGGRRHEEIIRESILEYTGIPVLGAIRRVKAGLIPERHLGLITSAEFSGLEAVIERMAELVMDGVDLDQVVEVARQAGPFYAEERDVSRDRDESVGKGVRIGIIRDAAFQFYYPENIESLEKAGAGVITVNAMETRGVEGIDLLYIGGGFPETNAPRIAENRSFMDSLKRLAEGGLPVYAECGGLMYLGKELRTGGRSYPMTGLLPVSFEMQERPVAHGYTELKVTGDNPFYPVGTVLRGHEFHYSRVTDDEITVPMAFSMLRGKGIRDGMDGLVYKNILATYTHVHSLGTPEWAEGIVGAARNYRRSRDELQDP